ncbi:hypothetical protein NVV99_13695 [Rhodococcus sp. PAE-6]|uniref:hypothetical protein n=1 Tax=Rhodococcus sp. PAE-6 TaxID=2972477 RepID=UPI0021B46F8C|nr:hypothetical protein [Rhodococcus sp. PAE-6]MCT7291994.1 hypothetical protein [Rhodococcus sp. PAE-6]
MTDTAAPQTPADVFTRVLTENIGRRVSIHNGLEGSRYTHGKIVAVEAGVLTLGESFPGMRSGEKPREWQSYHRIDSLTYVSPSSLDD